MEIYKGIEALRKSPFKNIAMEQGKALIHLTKRTRSIFRENIDQLLQIPDLQKADNQGFRERLVQMGIDTESLISEGGVSLSDRELAIVYDMGRLPFNRIVAEFINEVFPQFSSNTSRNPGVICVGYLLDLITIIDPEFATFNEGVTGVVEAMRETNNRLPAFLLGVMVDDVIRMRGNQRLQFDFLADRKGAEQFKEAFMEIANDDEKERFEAGVKVTLPQLYMEAYSISLN